MHTYINMRIDAEQTRICIIQIFTFQCEWCNEFTQRSLNKLLVWIEEKNLIAEEKSNEEEKENKQILLFSLDRLAFLLLKINLN